MSTARPNILLVVADCARSDKWLGPERPTVTPNLDRLASEGVSLTTTIVEKACTTPAFTSLLTGRYSPRHGVHLVWGYRLPTSVPMLTAALAEHGYHTYAEVSGPLLPGMGLARGFESYEYRAPCDYLHTAWGDAFVDKLRSGGYRRPWFILLHLWELHPHRHVAPQFDRPGFGRDPYERAVSSLDAQLARLFEAAGGDALIAFTGDHGEKTRFEQYRPGTAVEYTRELLGLAQADGMTPASVANWAGPGVLQELYGHCSPRMRQVRLREQRGRLEFSRATRLRDRLRLLWLTPWIYLHDLLSLGAPLRLTNMLRKRGLIDGRGAEEKVRRLARRVGDDRLFDMHMRMWINSYKANYEDGHMVHVYDYLVRVPLVLRWSGRLPAGTAFDAMVRQPDILPTILDLLGIETPALHGADGRSFRGLLEGGAYDPPPAFLSVSGCPKDIELRGVRTGRFKYTFGPENDELPQELYDLRADPGESCNLAAEQPERCGELRAMANAFVEGPQQRPDEIELRADEQQEVAAHLRALGYIE